MSFAIISDIHDNLINLKKCFDWCGKEKIENLICCGDVTNSETLGIISSSFKGQIYLVRGNLEIYEEDEAYKYKNIKYLGRFGRFEFENKIIGICHEPYFIRKVLGDGPCDIIFYGHTHKPWISNEDGIMVVNPGTLGGVFQKGTFAVWNTKEKEPELKILDNL